MKRQAITTTIKELQRIIEEFEKENTQWKGDVGFCDEEQPFQLNIINKEGLLDTWKFETPADISKRNKPSTFPKEIERSNKSKSIKLKSKELNL